MSQAWIVYQLGKPNIVGINPTSNVPLTYVYTNFAYNCCWFWKLLPSPPVLCIDSCRKILVPLCIIYRLVYLNAFAISTGVLTHKKLGISHSLRLCLIVFEFRLFLLQMIRIILGLAGFLIIMVLIKNLQGNIFVTFCGSQLFFKVQEFWQVFMCTIWKQDKCKCDTTHHQTNTCLVRTFTSWRKCVIGTKKWWDGKGCTRMQTSRHIHYVGTSQHVKPKVLCLILAQRWIVQKQPLCLINL